MTTEDFRSNVQNEVLEIKNRLDKKSNIKDVCTLLDMKSSKFPISVILIIWIPLDIEDVNKAFAEMHLEVERKVYKKEYVTAMDE